MIYIFETKLQTWDKNLNITRNVQIPSISTLADLGYLLITVYGAQGYHLFDFAIGKNIYGCDDESKKLASDLLLEKAFGRARNAVFTYDYGDDWTFDVKLVEKKDGEGHPCLLSGTGRGIVEDVGGIGGLAAFVEAFQAGKGEYYEMYCDWLGIKQYDAEACKVVRINEMVGESIETLRNAYEYRNSGDIEKFRVWFEDCFGVHYWADNE